jgi:hypothetical protein
MMRLFIVLLACAIPLSEALGCSCAYPKSTRDAFDEANVVVLGEAIAIHQHPSGTSEPSEIIEDAQAFAIHCRIHQEGANTVITALRRELPLTGGLPL